MSKSLDFAIKAQTDYLKAALKGKKVRHFTKGEMTYLTDGYVVKGFPEEQNLLLLDPKEFIDPIESTMEREDCETAKFLGTTPNGEAVFKSENLTISCPADCLKDFLKLDDLNFKINERMIFIESNYMFIGVIAANSKKENQEFFV